MIEVGKFQTLKVARLTSFGAYLDGGTGKPFDNILLPKGESPQDLRPGDSIDVFIFREPDEKLVAFRKKPLVQLGELGYLEVVSIMDTGAFLRWGLDRDLFLPVREQKYPVRKGQHYLVAVCLDKKERLCATTKIRPYLRTDSPYKKHDIVNGTVYVTQRELGAFVAVDNLYEGFIPAQEYFFPIHPGLQLQLRVANVRDDGRLDLSTRHLAHKQMKDDSAMLLELIKENGGTLPFNDHSHPSAIQRHLHISKKAFKRAVGRLLKHGQIEQTEWGIQLTAAEQSGQPGSED